MGRKIDIKMIENATRRQVTYSKRRTSLIKKAHELSVFCDIDVLLLLFSPTRRASAYCSRTSLEELLERFVNLPTVKKYEKNPNMKNVAEKLERLKGIESITDDEDKLHYLKNRINHLELQAKKFKIDLEVLDANIRDFEPSMEEEDPVAQAKLCLRSLKNSLQKLSNRKNVLLGKRPPTMDGQSSTGDHLNTYDDMRKLLETTDDDLLSACNFGGVELNSKRENRSSTRLIRHLDPWLSPFSNKARERILEGASVQLGNTINAYTQFPKSVPTFPSIPPSVPPTLPQRVPPPQKRFPTSLQSQSPPMTNSNVLQSPLHPPYDQAQRQRVGDRSFRHQMPITTNWMVSPPPARYNQQQGALEKPFMSCSNQKNGEGSSSQFQTNPNDQGNGIPKSTEFIVLPNQPLVPNQQSYKNQNNVVGALTSPFQENPVNCMVNCSIGGNENINLPEHINLRSPSLGTNESLLITSDPPASNNINSPIVCNMNAGSSNLIEEILSQHQLSISDIGQYSHDQVSKVTDNVIVDDHVGDLVLQCQMQDKGKSINISNEISVENANITSPNIDEILAIQDFETGLISLDDIFEEVEKMAAEKEGHQESASIEWDGFALAETLNSSNVNFIN